MDAWCLVKKGIIPLKPKKLNEFFRQPLFGNPRYLNENNIPWSLEPHSRWSIWAKNSIFTSGDLWNLQKKRWLNIREIKQITKSSTVDQLSELLLPSLPQNLEIIQLEDFHFSMGEWFLSKEDFQPRFLIFTTQESIELPFGLLFIQIPTLNWIPYDLIENKLFILIFIG